MGIYRRGRRRGGRAVPDDVITPETVLLRKVLDVGPAVEIPVVNVQRPVGTRELEIRYKFATRRQGPR